MSPTLRAVLATSTALVVAFILAGFVLAADSPSTQPKADDLSFYQTSSATAPYPLTSNTEVRNVILCIGDGMGSGQIALASRNIGGKLHLERMPVTGRVQTRSANSRVTDSAAAATALAIGIKTKNGMIGLSPDGQTYRSILELAKGTGMATGLVATSTITHATPASFGAHAKSRSSENTIAEQLLANRVNVLLGGGRKFFLPRSDRDSARKDNRDLFAEAQQAGYGCVTSEQELRSTHAPHVLGLFQLAAMTTVPPEPSLGTLASEAIRLLRQVDRASPTGNSRFFLMVEGSQIDSACHGHDAKRAIRQVLLFDQAVQAAIDFALQDGHTLVIVTADHETGGLSLSGGDEKNPETRVRWSTMGHTGSPVPIGAFGPAAALFAGEQDNTDIPKKIAHLLNIRPFPQPAE
jgi:alkaline phosphatase